MSLSRNLCLFDLDDTLLPLDSDHAWGAFMIHLGWVDQKEFRRRNDEFFEFYKVGKLDIHAYIGFVTAPLRTRSIEEMAAAQGQFMHEVIRPKMTDRAYALVHEHQSQGDMLALVTATNDFITAPIAEAFGIQQLIATQLERDVTGKITGRIHGVPSYREGKVTRVEQWLAQHGADWTSFDRISVYSDSPNDLPLLERATHPVATNPSPALIAIAQKRGWPILNLFT